MSVVELQKRIEQALKVAVDYGGISGDHHKAWVIDQMVRHLTGCPTVKNKMYKADDVVYEYDTLGESKAYKKLVKDAKNGEDGPETYEWDCGISP